MFWEVKVGNHLGKLFMFVDLFIYFLKYTSRNLFVKCGSIVVHVHAFLHLHLCTFWKFNPHPSLIF